ncbi:MAG: NAD(P)-dependent alcohol dehydrogenase [Nitrososphaerota archaeon]|nr:NAD(P)-dependent alcohol dehydrogenase [Nitrososphaerota archaeon]
MKAARLHEFGKPLLWDDVPMPELRTGSDVVVRIAAAGLCHTDLSVMDRALPDIKGRFPPLPFILGHENAGYVHAVGDSVTGLKVGDPVLVYGAWGCGTCVFCRRGEEQRCPVSPLTPGISPEYQGGFAEFMYVPSSRYLLKVEGNMEDLAPLTDAGLTSYRAAKRVRSHLSPGSFSLVIGAGGLGLYALQYLRLFGSSTVIAADIADDRLALAESFGASVALNLSKGDPAERVASATGGRGVKSVLDFVGTSGTAALAMRVLSADGIYVDVGLGGGTLSVPLIDLIHSESLITGSIWGTYEELAEAYELLKSGKVKSTVQKFRLSDINSAIAQMRRGELLGRAVLTS